MKIETITFMDYQMASVSGVVLTDTEAENLSCEVETMLLGTHYLDEEEARNDIHCVIDRACELLEINAPDHMSFNVKLS